jgi:Tfp pilus assembly protein PilF
MKRSYFLATAAVLVLIAGCSSSPEEQSAQADADMKQKRMELADEYLECQKDAAAYEEAKKKGEGDSVRPEHQKTKEQCEEINKMMEQLK